MLASRLRTGGVLFLAVGIVVAPQPSVSAAQASNQKAPAFEVASVKPNRSADSAQEFLTTPDGSSRLTNATARMLIRQAYRVQDFQIADAPSWTDADRFDVTARAPRGATAADVPEMLRGVLEERFGLIAHRETRDMPIYALVIGRRGGALGQRLVRTPAAASAECAARRASINGPERSDGGMCGIGITSGTIRAGDATLGQLLGLLSPLVGRTTVDKTQLAGRFDYDLNWTLDPFANGGAPSQNERATDVNGSSLFTALREQLGLRLEPQRGGVSVLVIDRIEHPTPD